MEKTYTKTASNIVTLEENGVTMDTKRIINE